MSYVPNSFWLFHFLFFHPDYFEKYYQFFVNKFQQTSSTIENKSIINGALTESILSYIEHINILA